MPNLDNLLILSKVLHTSIEDIIVYGGGDMGNYKYNDKYMYED